MKTQAAQQLAQLSALDRVMAIAEFELDGALSRANDNFLALLGLPRRFSASVNKGLLQPLVGPSLPADFSRQLEGVPIGPDAGSCGIAAGRNETVQVDDIASDPLWAQHKQYGGA